jgi:tetratricopeptide (TPR) repeat protein
MRHLRGTLALLASCLLLACPSPQERSERARADAREALRRGDRAAALAALDVLRELRAESSEDPLEFAELLVKAGEAAQAVWVLQEAVHQSPERDELRIALAQAALLVGDAAAARDALVPIGKDSNKHLDALVLRSQAELRLGDFNRAVATLTQAEQLYPDRPEARLAHLAALLQDHRFEEAHRALEESREPVVAAGQEDALRRLEIALYTQEGETNPDASIAGLRAIIAQAPDDSTGWQALAQVMNRAGRLPEVTKELEAAIAREPASSAALLPILASLQQAADHPEEAQRTLRKLIESSPSPNAYLALARQHSARHDDAGMLAVFDEALAKFPDDPMLQRMSAESLVSAGQMDRARKAIGDYAARFPKEPETEYLRARLELAEGDAKAAADRLGRLVPTLDRSWTQHWLGRALEATGDRAGAERRYQLALERDTNDPELYVKPIEMAERRGNWLGSSALGRQLVMLDPDNYTGWAAWAGGMAQKGSGSEAVSVARRALKRFGDRADAQLLLVRALRTHGDYDEALSLLGEVERRFGDSPELAAERILTLGMGRRVEEGLKVGNGALARYPDSAALQKAWASLLFAAGRADEGAKAVDRALELAPEDAQPLAIRARFRAATGRLEDARRDLDLYLSRQPDDAQAHFMLGAVREQSGDAEGAIASYRKAAELDPSSFEARNNLALVLADRDLDGALAAAQEAYRIRADNPAVLDTLGGLYLRKGLVDRATSLLEQAHQAAPELAEVQLHLALAYRDGRRTDDARRLLVALEKRSDVPPALGAQIGEAKRSLQ